MRNQVAEQVAIRSTEMNQLVRRADPAEGLDSPTGIHEVGIRTTIGHLYAAIHCRFGSLD